MTQLVLAAVILSVPDRPIDGFRSKEQNFDDTPYCGIYSVYAAASALGVEADFKRLIQEKYVPRVQGSTSSELVAAFGEFGLDAEVFVDATAETLRQLHSPAVLHLRSPGRGAPFQHWVTYLGVENGEARILDSVNAMQTLPFAELLAHWDGVAIVPGAGGRRWAFASLATASLWLVWPAAIAILLFAAARVREGRLPRSSVSLTALSVIAGTLAATHSVGDSLGLRRNAGAVGAVVAHDFAPDLPSVTKDDVRAVVKDPNTVLVDARGVRAYQAFHLPNAVSLPIGAGLSDRDQSPTCVPTAMRALRL